MDQYFVSGETVQQIDRFINDENQNPDCGPDLLVDLKLRQKDILNAIKLLFEAHQEIDEYIELVNEKIEIDDYSDPESDSDDLDTLYHNPDGELMKRVAAALKIEM